MRPTAWNASTYDSYEKHELRKGQENLVRFVDSAYKTMKVSSQTHTCVILNSPFVDSTLVNYAADNAFDFICISTRGAGLIEKLFGTTTANLINQSSVPVIAVPGNYRASRLTSILYASDLSSLEHELKQVVGVAKPLAATVELRHFSAPSEPVTDPAIIQMAVQKFTKYPVAVHLQARDLSISLTDEIEMAVKAAKPSMLLMFTRQNEGFFKRLFLSGNSVDCSFLTTVPLLVFRKA